MGPGDRRISGSFQANWPGVCSSEQEDPASREVERGLVEDGLAELTPASCALTYNGVCVWGGGVGWRMCPL